MANLPTQVPTPDTTPAPSGLVYFVDDPYGTPADNAATIENIIKKGHNLSDGFVKVSTGVMTSDTNGLDTTDLAAGVLDTDLSSVSALDDTIPSAKATKTALDGKAASSHTHAQADITNLTSDLAAKKTDSMSTNKLLGRGTAGTGVIEEITLGTNLSLSGTTLNATGGGSVTVEDESLIIGMRFFGF